MYICMYIRMYYIAYYDSWHSRKYMYLGDVVSMLKSLVEIKAF